MNNESKNGFSIGGIVAIIAAFAIVVGGIYFAVKKTPPPEPTPTQTANPTETPVATNTPPADPYGSWKTYDNKNIGISVRYPLDYLVKSEGYGTDGFFKAVIVSNDKNEISINLVNDTLIDAASDEPKLQGSNINIGGKTGTLFNSREGVCDVANARVEYDKTYSLRMTFKSCGPEQKLFSDKEKIKSILASVSFNNNSTYLFIDTKEKIAFRYPRGLKFEPQYADLGASAPVIGYSLGNELTVMWVKTASSSKASTATDKYFFLENPAGKNTVQVHGKGPDFGDFDTVVNSLVLIK